MDPNIRNFSQIEKFIKENPKLAQEQAFEWQEFLKRNAREAPELYSIETAEEFHQWIQAHPERHVDPKIFVGKEISEAYYYLREQNENAQMQNQGSIDISNVPESLAGLSVLASAYLQRPKIMQEDMQYQKIEETLKEDWLKNNPGKDFSSEEGINYLYGKANLDLLRTGAGEDLQAEENWQTQWAKSVNVDLPKTATIASDAEKAFRNNPKFAKRMARYDKNAKKIYKNPQNDPALRENERKTQEHIQARQAYLKTASNASGASLEETTKTIRKLSQESFAAKYPEKSTNYAREINDRKEERQSNTQSQSFQRILRKIQQEEMGPKIPRQTPRAPGRLLRRVFGRGTSQAGRGVARVGGRLASRVASQAAMAAGRAAVQGLAALVANPVGLIVIGVIILIVIIVFLIVMLAGGGRGSGPTVECFDSFDSNAILVADGNRCADVMAELYTREEGITVTAKCLDKCTDFISLSCNRNSSYSCSSPDMCVVQEAFCIEYTPQDLSKKRQHDCLTGGAGYYYKSGSQIVNSCSDPRGAPTPSATLSPEPPTPTPAGP